MAPKCLGHLAAQERFHKPEVATLTKSGHQREIFDTSQLLKTPELQDQRSDFNYTYIALINFPCRPLQGGNNIDVERKHLNYIDGLVQDCRISIALAIEILQFCT